MKRINSQKTENKEIKKLRKHVGLLVFLLCLCACLTLLIVLSALNRVTIICACVISGIFGLIFYLFIGDEIFQNENKY